MDGFAGWLGIADAQGADGAVRVELQAEDRHLNPAGTVHGGLLATLVDTAMGAAVRSESDADSQATSQLTIAYLRPATTGLLVATARVRKEGAHLLLCDAEVEQDGKRIVQALATFAALQR